jgi:hypothetical protein
METEKSKIAAAQKAAHTKKWRRASERAHARARNAKTFTKYLLGKKGYKTLSLDSRKGYEYIGVVGLIAAKRDRKDPDILHLVLFQVKGGSARLSKEELNRLKQAVRNIKVYWNVAEKPGKSVKFRRPLA